MAVLITEPEKDNPATDDWQKSLYLSTFRSGGYMKLMLTNIDNSLEPMVMKGSRLEVNGSLYLVEKDEPIEDDKNVLEKEQMTYAYARVKPDSLIFEFSQNKPVYDAVKGAWFEPNTTDRAVAKMYRTAEGFWGKVILETYSDMSRENYNAVPANAAGGTKVLEVKTCVIQDLTNGNILEKGVYRYELKGGTGGRGGYSSRPGAEWTSTPGNGAPGEIKKGVFILPEKSDVRLSAGGNGNVGGYGNGDSGGGCTQSGGGGGASGGSAYIAINHVVIDVAEGGSGGGGCGADGTGKAGGGGGGGGGGYGVGGTGSSAPDAYGGLGGNDFAGGQGRGGGSASGYGATGASGRTTSLSMESTSRNGGSGGYGYAGTATVSGGAAGVGVTNASDGYALIYKLW